MNLLKKLKPLKYLFMPHFWLVNEEYSEELDRLINAGIDTNKAKLEDKYHCRIGSIQLWVGNYPYCFGTYEKRRPSRDTIARLNKHLRVQKHKLEDVVEKKFREERKRLYE